VVSEDDIRRLAAETAREANLPWDSATVTLKRPLLGRFARVRIATSVVRSPEATAMIAVDVRAKRGRLVRVTYRGPSTQPRDVRLLLTGLATGAVMGCVAFVILRFGVKISVFPAGAAAITWAWLGMLLSLHFRTGH
jgi:hypothetical protein